MDAERVKRLKDLVETLERLPASPDRDRVLSEVRSRAVDLDTGVTPRAMLPIREPTPPPQRDRAPIVARTMPAPPAPAVKLRSPAFTAVPPKDAEQTFFVDDVLSLEDSPLPHLRAHGDGAVSPWTLGLRG